MPDPRAKFLITAATDFAKAEREAKTFLGSLQSSAKVALGTFAVGTGVAATGLTALAVSAANSADALAKQSDKLDIATEKLAALQLQGRLTGVENRKLTIGLQRMTRRIAEAAKGTGEAQAAIKELGLDAADLVRLPLDKQFEAVAAAMQTVDLQADRVRLGFKLFDAEGVDIIRTLDAMEDGFSKTEAEAKAFGVAISRLDARRIEQAKDAAERAKTAIQGIGTTVAIAASALAKDFATGFADAAVEANGFRSEVNAAMEAIVIGANFAINSVRGIQLAFKGAQLALLRIRESLETGAPKLAGGLAVGFGAPGAAAEINKAIAALPDQSTERVDRIRGQIDETGRQIDELVGKFKTGEEVVAQFRASQAAAIESARRSLAESGAPGDPDGSGNEQSLFGEREREQLAKRLSAVQSAFQTEVESIRQVYVEREAIIAEAFERELISEQERTELRVANAQDAANRVLAIEQRRIQQQEKLEKRHQAVLAGFRSQAVDTAIGLLQQLGAQSESLARAAILVEKGFAVARIIINTNAAAVRAVAELGPIAGPPMAARITAWGYGLAAATAALGIAQASLVGEGSTGAPLGTPTNPVFSEGFTRPPQGTGPQEPAVEIHFHGPVLNTRETGDHIGEIVRGLTDRDVVLFSGTSRQAAVIREGRQ